MSTVTSSYRIRAYPNGAQRRLLDRWLGATRWLWNTALEIRSAAYRECGLTLTGNDLSRWLTQWKRTIGHEWLAEIPVTTLTQCLRDQDRAFKNFFAHRACFPRYKRKEKGAFHCDAHQFCAIWLESSQCDRQIVRQALLEDAFVLLVNDGEKMIV